MTPARWRQVSDLFHRAADLPPADRAALLDLEVGDDPTLRREVGRMLALDAGVGPLDTSPTARMGPRPDADP